MRIIKTGAILTPQGELRGHFIMEEAGLIIGILPVAELDWAEKIAEEILEFPEDSWALPGFFDSHAHALQRGIALIYPNLSGARTPEEAGEIIARNLDFPERPIIFLDYDDSCWEAEPTRAWLDRVAPRVPVIIRRVCGHKAVANSPGLEMLPPEAEVASGEEGLLLEETALSLLGIFPPSEQTLQEACLRAQEELLGLGITGLREIGSLRSFRAWERLARRGLLGVNMEFFFPARHLERLLKLGLETGFGGRLSIGGIKVFLDGSVGARTARFQEPYADTRGRGVLLVSWEEFRDTVIKAQEGGLRVMAHAIGDEAVEIALSVYEEVSGRDNPLGHSIEHAEAISPRGIERAKNAGVVLSVQPNFLRWQGEGGLYEKALGKERARAMNPFGTMLKKGARVVFGSDSMPPGPQIGISLAVHHPSPSESIEAREGVRVYTHSKIAVGESLNIAITNGLPGDKVYGVLP